MPSYQIQPGEYYRRISESDEKGYDSENAIAKGELAICVKVTMEYAHMQCGDHTWMFPLESFWDTFEPAPNGAKLRQEEIANLIQDSQNLQRQSFVMQETLSNFSPHVANEGEQVDPGMAIIPIGGGAAPEEMKRQLATVSNDVKKFQIAIDKRTKRIQSLMKEQSEALAARLAGLNELVSKAAEAIWTINLYLGKDEEIKQIKKGTPATAETKITIRQLVLFADEECAISAHEGGLDFTNLDEFDEWVSIPKNMQQVIPDLKGVVAIKPRRKDMRYESSDTWANSMRNEANKKTYFLIRNGENLYRICTELEVFANLVPLRDEFTDLFWVRDSYNFRSNSDAPKEAIRPGSDDYMKAMDKADEKQRHYMRILLFLQGILDRTPIFRPLPGPRINILKKDNHFDYVQYIYDAEMLLPSGRLSFDDWISEINGKLDVGMRVIGNWRSYYSGIGSREGRRDRLGTPSADLPNENALYTIDRKEKDGVFAFLYHRTDKVWRGGSWGSYGEIGEAKKRVSCKVFSSDKFLLNFDLATVEDMEYYIDSRTDRHEYLALIPLMRIAIEMKKQEIKDEIPFRKLLIGQIMKEHGAPVSEAEAAIDDLIDWWKFKNKTHRALVATDDSKAIRMIVQEFGLMMEREKVREEYFKARQEITSEMLSKHPNAMMIAHKSDNIFVVCVPENDENVFLSEFTYTRSKVDGYFKVKEAKSWTTMDKRHIRWKDFYKTDRWDKWKFGASKKEWFTDEERKQAIAYATSKEVSDMLAEVENRHSDKKCISSPLCVNLDPTNGVMTLYSMESGTKKNRRKLSAAPDMNHVKIYMSRNRDGTVETTINPHTNRGNSFSIDPSEAIWNNQHFHDTSRNPSKTIWKNEENIAFLVKEYTRCQEEEDEASRLEGIGYRYFLQVREVMFNTWKARTYGDFKLEYGDDALFDDYLKEKKVSKDNMPGMHSLSRLLVEMVTRNVIIEGKTLGYIMDEAKKLKIEYDEDDEKVAQIGLPLDYTFKNLEPED